ncbi:uncharacterized protein TNIN_155151 [Trichonephila inaurata madagascariensis]|uniref:Uncharacterized protein n=1 Tax=Trichonephila inaurata madagascariensis TaxID=2747483 RepID=A0A8X6Y623_9ARAC|nr:uncharacterized protein TNIN_155151 [Trichonephila inaurata madagascariensis]
MNLCTPTYRKKFFQYRTIYEVMISGEMFRWPHTQNVNESFNSTTWRLAPKHLHSGLKIVELASYLARGLFNEGNSSLLMVMNEAGIVVRRKSFNYAEQMDNQCVSWQNRLEVHWNRKKVGKHCCKRKTKSMKKKDCCMVLESPINR